ncbi:(2Fe-2S)-binding protein [Salinicola corii]|uniref:(2Fe-2S)-binding protein n=1 Tax=Salinicola corii TaxID=2606937 RepID=A0A640WIG8_9GAMM|nr:(2Fe-2S)-binding protein [Salinicola corii]KAA0020380.1 (2Fe-2S)-binding protein [Salinicola corii]
MTDSIALRVNGEMRHLPLDPATPLLQVLRNDLCLNGPKYGCGLGQCGACSVLIEGRVARACVISLGAVAGRDVVTLEGLGESGQLDPVQTAFIDCQAAQCGYCLNGMIMTVRGLLNHCMRPSREKIVSALNYNLCRCGTHVEILEAAMLAAELDAAGMAPSEVE